MRDTVCATRPTDKDDLINGPVASCCRNSTCVILYEPDSPAGSHRPFNADVFYRTMMRATLKLIRLAWDPQPVNARKDPGWD